MRKIWFLNRIQPDLCRWTKKNNWPTGFKVHMAEKCLDNTSQCLDHRNQPMCLSRMPETGRYHPIWSVYTISYKLYLKEYTEWIKLIWSFAT